MLVQIFDVEHGGCALVTADTGARLLIDCGHNSTESWRPSIYLPQNGITTIDYLFITNYDEDHVSDLANLRRVVQINALARNRTVGPGDLKRLKSETGAGQGIESLIDMGSTYTADVTSPPDLGDLKYSLYHATYPTDFEDENNLSMVVFLHYHDLHMVFPGDLEVPGWGKLLQNSLFVDELRQVNVFVASHHGRESGCCKDVFDTHGCKPQVVIFSDKGVMHDTQRTASWYASRAWGMQYNGENRFVFSTRNDGRILIEATPTTMTLEVGS